MACSLAKHEVGTVYPQPSGRPYRAYQLQIDDLDSAQPRCATSIFGRYHIPCNLMADGVVEQGSEVTPENGHPHFESVGSELGQGAEKIVGERSVKIESLYELCHPRAHCDTGIL